MPDSFLVDEDSREGHPLRFDRVACQHQYRTEPGDGVTGLDLDLQIDHIDASIRRHRAETVQELRISRDDGRARSDPTQVGIRCERNCDGSEVASLE